STPGPERYTGLYESRSLAEGLDMVAKLLKLEYGGDESAPQWLIIHGVQPQPDIFEKDPAQVFANPYILPKGFAVSSQLFATDLAACNGANPRLAAHLAKLAGQRLCGLVGFNTNFNSLATTAAWLALARYDPRGGAGQPGRRFLLERLADDVVYQALARPKLIKYLRSQDLDPMDFSNANEYQLQQCRKLVERTWRNWHTGEGSAVLAAFSIPRAQAESMQFEFPWQRAFEIEASVNP
ncbi:DUF4127 family protein, partial [bacterium]|nr:DUF4127 family protein [bacterium]